MLNPYLADAVFLDVFAGSGGIGIEALSRGAKQCYFVEQNKTALSVIRDNLKFTRLADQAVVLGTEAHSALNQLLGKPPFDVIFLDPPYNHDLEKDILLDYADASFIGPDTLIVAEASVGTDFSWVEGSPYRIIKIKKYKTNVHVFLELDVDGE